MMFCCRALRVSNTLAALIAAAMFAVCGPASAQTTAPNLLIGYPGGFAGGTTAIAFAAAGAVNGSEIQLTSGAIAHQAGSAWYKTQVNVQSFTTSFTFQLPPNGTSPSIQGMTFCIQNSNVTTNPYWGGNPLYATNDANLAGYGMYLGQVPIGNSVAVKFDLNNYAQFDYPAGGHPNSTGLYINGGPVSQLVSENDLNPYAINLYSGHVFSATIVYDGTLLTMTLLDTTTNAQARYVWPINIPAVTGDKAYVGFTAGEVNPVAQNLLSWSYSSGYSARLATPTFSLTPGSYASAQQVTISGPAGAKIYYSTNGLLPTSSSTLYTGPVTVNASEVIQAVAIEPNFTDSLVATGNYQIAPAGTPVINFPSGFASASNLVKLTGYSYFSGSSIRISDTTNYMTVGAAWYAAPVNVQAFSTNFTLDFDSSNSNGSPGLGTTFTIQNQPTTTSTAQYGYVSGGPTALGNSNSALGYGYETPGSLSGTTGGLLNSVAVKFDLSNNATGLYKDGALPVGGDVSITGVTLSSGHPLNVTLAYNGTKLTLTIKDSVTSASFAYSWTIDIPTTVGGNTAFVGFTGSSGWFVANQSIQSWTYAAGSPSATPAVPNAPTGLVVR